MSKSTESKVDPKLMTAKQECRLENWRIARLKGKQILFGDVFGHPSLRDGTRVTTNNLLSFEEYGSRAETLNTVYHLGKKG